MTIVHVIILTNRMPVFILSSILKLPRGASPPDFARGFSFTKLCHEVTTLTETEGNIIFSSRWRRTALAATNILRAWRDAEVVKPCFTAPKPVSEVTGGTGITRPSALFSNRGDHSMLHRRVRGREDPPPSDHQLWLSSTTWQVRFLHAWALKTELERSAGLQIPAQGNSPAWSASFRATCPSPDFSHCATGLSGFCLWQIWERYSPSGTPDRCLCERELFLLPKSSRWSCIGYVMAFVYS